MRKIVAAGRLTAQFLLGVVWVMPLAYAQAELPLSGPAFVMADEAYKAYASGDYRRAEEKVREALRLRPDAMSLRALLAKVEAAQAPQLVAKPTPSRPKPRQQKKAGPGIERAPVAEPAFLAADAAYKAYAEGNFSAAAAYAASATRLAPANRAYRLLLVRALAGADRFIEADQAITEGIAQAGDDGHLAAEREQWQRRLAQRRHAPASVALAPANPGYAAAAAAYKAFETGNFARAAVDARQAVQLSPDNRDYRRLLVNALYRDGQYLQADEAASLALATDDRDATMLAQQGLIRQQLGLQAEARNSFEAALATGQLPAATEIGLLTDLQRFSGARRRFDAAVAAGDLDDLPAMELAYLAARVGDEAQALEAFNRADASGELRNTAYADAAFAAVRAGADVQAVGYFKRTIDDAGALKLKMTPQLVFDTRRAVAEVSRETGVIASLTYRGAVSGLGVTPGANTDSLQAGIEGYWRPWGYRNGQYVEVFARAFETLRSQGGGATGTDTLQAAVGLRYKPFSSTNVLTSFSRVFAPQGGRDDWLVQPGLFGWKWRRPARGRARVVDDAYLGRNRTLSFVAKRLRVERTSGGAEVFVARAAIRGGLCFRT